MTLFFSDNAAGVGNDAVKALFNTGTIKIYAATQPTDANTAVGAQTLLATFTCASTAFGSSAASGTTPSRSSVATAAAISDVTAAASGTAAWFRALKSDGTTVICDGSVTATGGGGDLTMTDVSLTSGETCSVQTLTLATPE
jgi:hypothetical protein